MPTRTPLIDWLAQPDHTQGGLARAVGITQGAVSQMVRSSRLIFVVEDGEQIWLEEHKRLAPSQSAA